MNPSCFGWPSVFNAASATCSACSVKSDCLAACKVLAVKMRQSGAPQTAPVDAGVGEVIPGKQAPSQFGVGPGQVNRGLTPDEQIVCEKLPKKVAPRYQSMVRTGFTDRAAIQFRAGINPFRPKDAKFLRLACDRLLSGGVSKKELKQAYRESFNWTEGTAASHVSVVVALLPVIGLARINGDCLAPVQVKESTLNV
jgi:hypothetical protein